MYTRSFNDGSSTLNIPSEYGGNAIRVPEVDIPLGDTPTENATHTNEDDSIAAGLQPGRHSGRVFSALGDLLSGFGLSMPKIGTEEIIILAIAAFLIFSPGGDKECAIMLLALLFIH